MAASLTGLSSMATRQVLADLAALYARNTGRDVAIESVGGLDAALRIRAGEVSDVVVLASTVMAQLEAEGHIAAGSCVDVVRSDMALAVPADGARPAVGDAEAVKEAMLNARAVCFSTGPSGDHLKRLWQGWGIADAMAARAVLAPPGMPVATILARGGADLGVQQLSELLDAPGIAILGPLPPEAQLTTVFTAGVGTASRQGEEARDFLAFLISSDADAAKRRRGLEPAGLS